MAAWSRAGGKGLSAPVPWPLVSHGRLVPAQNPAHPRREPGITPHAGEQRTEQPDLLLGDLPRQPSHERQQVVSQAAGADADTLAPPAPADAEP